MSPNRDSAQNLTHLPHRAQSVFSLPNRSASAPYSSAYSRMLGQVSSMIILRILSIRLLRVWTSSPCSTSYRQAATNLFLPPLVISTMHSLHPP
jgi:hypothetical protein